MGHPNIYGYMVRTPWEYGYMAAWASEQKVDWIGCLGDWIPLRLL